MGWILTTKKEEGERGRLKERERERKKGGSGGRERAREKRVKGSTRQNINLYVNRTKAGGLEAALVVMLMGGNHKASRGGLPY